MNNFCQVCSISKLRQIASMVIGLQTLCLPFSGFSFDAHGSTLCSMLCANRPYTANSLTYPFRARPTGLLGLMDKTDHTRPRWKDKSCAGESRRGGTLWGKPSLCCTFFSFPFVETDLIENLGAQLWVVSVSLIYFCFRPCRAKLLGLLLAILWPLTLGLTHPDDLWLDRNRISVSDLYSCHLDDYFKPLTCELQLHIDFASDRS